MTRCQLGFTGIRPWDRTRAANLTATHGVDAGDLPALALLLVAVCLAI